MDKTETLSLWPCTRTWPALTQAGALFPVASPLCLLPTAAGSPLTAKHCPPSHRALLSSPAHGASCGERGALHTVCVSSHSLPLTAVLLFSSSTPLFLPSVNFTGPLLYVLRIILAKLWIQLTNKCSSGRVSLVCG